MRHFLIFTGLVAAFLGLPPLAGAVDLQMSLVMEKARFVPGEPVVAWILYENLTAHALIVPGPLDHPPLEVLDSKNRRVPYHGEQVEYIDGDGSLRLAAGAKFVLFYQLTENFVLLNTETYTVRARVIASPSGGIRKKGDPADAIRYGGEAVSNSASFSVSDADDPGAKIILRCSEKASGWANCLVAQEGELVQLGPATALASYVEIQQMMRERRRLHQHEDVLSWRLAFLSNHPHFDQPGYLSYQLSHVLENNEGDMDQLHRLQLAMGKSMKGHPIEVYLQQHEAQVRGALPRR